MIPSGLLRMPLARALSAIKTKCDVFDVEKLADLCVDDQ